MATFNALYSMGWQSMTAQKYALGVVGNNMANAANPNYTRQIPRMQALMSGSGNPGSSTGDGVWASDTNRAYDWFIQQQIMIEQGKNSSLKSQELALKEIDIAYNESSEVGLSKAMDDFFSATEELTTDPSNLTLRNMFLTSAETVAHRFRSLATALNNSREEMDNRIQQSVNNINSVTSQIAELNKLIARSDRNGEGAGSLWDQRDELISQIAQEANVSIQKDENGSIRVLIGGQTIVAEEWSAKLATKRDENNDGLSRITLNDNSISLDITDDITEGSIGGTLKIRDENAVSYLESLDDLAYTFIQEINTIHSQGYGLDGQTGRNLFTPAAIAEGSAFSMTLSSDLKGNPNAVAAAMSSSATAGDSSNAINLYELGNQKFFGGTQTFSEHYYNQAGLVGNHIYSSQVEVGIQQKVLDEVSTTRAAISGVSLDQESADMLKYQTAYQAAAKFIGTVRELSQTLMQLV